MSILPFKYPKGRIEFDGLYFDKSIPESEIKARILELWCHRSILYKYNDCFILIEPLIKQSFIGQCLGSPLIRQFDTLSNVILDASIKTLNFDNTQLIVLAKAGILQEFELKNELRFDPSVWLNLSNYHEQTVVTLGIIKKPQAKKSLRKSTVRETLNENSLKDSPDLERTLNKLKQINNGDKKISSSRSNGFSVFIKGFVSIFQWEKSQSSPAGPNDESNHNYSSQVFRHTSIFKKLRNLFAKALMSSALAKAIGNKQAKHVQKMMDMFKNGDLDEALQNAIPLSNLQDALQNINTSLSLKGGRLPNSIQPFANRSSGSVELADNLIHQLNSMYEHAFKLLDKAGKFKKAAFVLAELLRDIDRAVAYLEKHKQFTLAAELAEGQKLSPARIVRQWILAKDIYRAMQIATIAGCYQEAITALQKNHKEHADQLRIHCAQLHYKSGNLESAVDIAWPVEHYRSNVIGWMKESVKLDGKLAARHLLRLSLHDKENFDYYLVEINKLFEAEDSGIGLALLDEIVSNSKSKTIQRIASLATRFYLLQVSKGNLAFENNRWNSLCLIAGDLTLRADVRGLDLHTCESKYTNNQLPKSIYFAKTFGRQAQDCCVLQGAKVLLAFGDSGVELWNSKGKLITHYAISCNKIIVSDFKTKAILISTRSGYQVVHKFDLKTRSINYWLDLDFHHWADNYDGNLWIVSNQNSIYILDVHSANQSTLWSVNNLPGLVTHIRRSPDSFSVCIAVDNKFEIWVYSLPNLYLKERTPHQQEKLIDFKPEAINDRGKVVGISHNDPQKFGIYDENKPINWQKLKEDLSMNRIEFHFSNIYVVSSLEDKLTLDLFFYEPNQILLNSLSIEFEGEGRLIMRIDANSLLIHHSDGRVVTIDLISYKVLSDYVC